MSKKGGAKMGGRLVGAAHRRKWKRIFVLIVAAVVLATSGALMIPATTVEGNTYCGIEEHIHDDTCFADGSTCDIKEHIHTLACYSNSEADLETQFDWEKTLPNGALEHNKTPLIDAKKLIAVAKSQIGYQESMKNYEVAGDDKTIKGYSRYGAWNGTPYEPWGLAFVAFCLYYSGADQGLLSEILPNGLSDEKAWIQKLKNAGFEKTGDDVAPRADFAPGDLVFLKPETEGSVTVPHMGIVIRSDQKSITLIEGDRDDAVVKNSYRNNSDDIMAVFSVCREDSENADVEEAAEVEKAAGADVAAGTEAAADELAEAEDNRQTLTYTGKGFAVTASCSEAANIPEDAVLEVKEIIFDRPYQKAAKESFEEIGSTIQTARFFDISIMDGKEEIEPDQDVTITFAWDKAETLGSDSIDSATTIKAIHLPENEAAEILDVETGEDPEAGETVTFTASSFSVYGIVYTVDFHYEVDGVEYTHHIRGGEGIALSELVEITGLLDDVNERAEQTGASEDLSENHSYDLLKSNGTFATGKDFVAAVESVTFSSSDLVSVSKVEENTTIGAIKDRLGLMCEYSAELTEDEIAEINGSRVEAGDWVLISLKPFTSEETLTVKMVNGDEWTVNVTDVQDPDLTHTTKFVFAVSDVNGGYFSRDNQTYTTWALNTNNSGTECVYTVVPQIKSGYRFVNWINVTNGSIYQRITYNPNGIKPKPEEGTEFVATFVKNGYYMLTYQAGAHGSVSRYWDTTEDLKGATASPDLGYVFEGWYIGDELVSDVATLPISGLTIDKDTVLIAKFREAQKHTITYEVQQPRVAIKGKTYEDPRGVGRSDSEEKYEGETPSGAVANNTSQHNFKCWVRKSDGKIMSLTNDLDLSSETVESDETYVAVYRDNQIFLKTNDNSYGWIKQGNTHQENTFVLVSFWDDEGNVDLHSTYIATAYDGFEFDYWEWNGTKLSIGAGAKLLGVKPDSDLLFQNLIAHFRPVNTYKISYVADGLGTVSNASDFAGSETAIGSTAIPNSGQHFLGWYFSNGNLAKSSEAITAEDLIGWKNSGYISEGSVLTAKFGEGFTLTYQQQLDDGTPAQIGTELVTANAPNGYSASSLTGYNFLGWYEGETLITANPDLTSANIGTVTQNRTFTAKYATTHVATYEVEHLNVAKSGVSNYGQIVVGSESTTLSATQNANAENVLTSGATAIPARGCDFVGWEVTENGTVLTAEQVQLKYGFDVNSTSIPAGLKIESNITFKAKFQKQSGAMEIIYTIQEDEDPSSHAAKLTVNGISVEGNGSDTAYISEVVPAGAAALGCMAEGLYYSGQQYEIRGWVLGDDNAPNKDSMFVDTPSFTPVGEYLEDVNHDGVRYFRVVTKKSKNIYVIFKVSPFEGGYIGHSSGDNQTEKLIYLNSEDAPSHRTEEQIFRENKSTSLNYYGVYVNPGYKLVGFTYNGKELNLKAPSTKSGDKLPQNSYKIIDPDTSEEVDLIAYMKEHSELYLDESTTSVERNVNILIARFQSEGYNIEYHVKGGIGGTLSNYADSYLATETPVINGSTAMANTDNDYVFVRWENDKEETVSTDPHYAPRVDEITQTSPYVYHYYAVFEYREKLDVIYEPDDPSHGVTNPGSETVHQGVPANGSLATAYEGYVFSHWTKDGDDETVISTDPNFIPNIYGVSETDTDHVTQADFTAKTPVKFIAHFRTEIDSKITVSKVVNVSDGLSADKVDTVIYIGLTKNGEEVTDKNGQPLIKEIVIENGSPKNTVTFEGLPYNDLSNEKDKYEIWEMHKVGSVYERQYIGMLIGDDYQLSAISTSNNSSYNATEETYSNGSGNNAILTEDHKEATVTLTNTYSKETDTVSFEVIKEWQDSDGHSLTGKNIPSGAKVEMTVYSENNGVTRAVKSIWLDGIVDDKGETEEWKATFKNLPKYASNGTTELTYKVRETGLWEGYKPYINSGSTYLSENLYLYNNGGKIINKADKANTTLITVKKVDKQDVSKLLEGATFYLSKNTEDVYEAFKDGSHADGIYSVGGVGDGLGLFSVALPDGEYKLQEKESPAGYVVVTGAFEFKIVDGTLTGANGEYISFDSDNMMITIKNERGVELPSTGGSGTRIFTILGSILVCFAGVMLMMRRRRMA